MICRKNPSFLIFRGWVIVLKWLEFIKEYDYDKEFEDNTHESSSESYTDETSHEAESLDSQNLFLVGRVSRFGRAVKISSRFLSWKHYWWVQLAELCKFAFVHILFDIFHFMVWTLHSVSLSIYSFATVQILFRISNS